MADETSNYLTTLAFFTQKIGVELVHAAPGKDDGLIPINSLLSDMEELAAQCPLLSPLARALTIARHLVDSALEKVVFDRAHLDHLGRWVKWMQDALPLAQAGQDLPELLVLSGHDASCFSSDPRVVTSAQSPESAGDPSCPSVLLPEEPLLMNLQNDGDLLREFFNESNEHLQNIELGVLTLEEHPADAETLHSIFRAFHTFKGGSGFLNLLPMRNLAHELESLLDLARNHKLTVNSEIINLILEGGDTLKRFISEMGDQLAGSKPPGPILVSTRALLTRVRGVLLSHSPASSRSANHPPEGAPLPAREGAVSFFPEADTSAAAACGLPANTMVLPGSTKSSGDKVAGPGKAGHAVVVKVEIQKLDSLVDLVGEMVIAQSLIAQDKDLATLQSQHLSRNLAQLRRITSELQRTAMSMRMVPIRATFQKMTRLVRDTAARMNKQAELTMEGEETELDRTIVEEISDPLIHMVRNSIDHGIESPEARVAAGKPPTGRVHLRSFHQGGNIVIEIKDDGGGLDRERLFRKAVEKGLVGADQQLSEKETFNLIFAPGFSTAAVITDISGRGVGMDVVRKNIDKLRGKIEIQSTLGHGSTFTIFLPLTLAIIDGLVVSVGSEHYILPTLSVRESFRPTAEMVSAVQERGEVVNVRGRLSPLLRLYDHFGIEPESRNPTEGILVVVEADGAERCILVDRLLGKQEVVIKSLGSTFRQNSALAGAAILGDGRVGLILDVNALVKLRTIPRIKKAA